MADNPNQLNLAVVGAGEFATFAAHAFLKIPGIRISAVTDVNPAAAQLLAGALNANVYPDLPALLQDERVQLVYIASPPALHYPQSKLALKAGKHVICEKPAALRTAEAEELAAYARQHRLLYVVNLMQRYNPMYALVKTLIEEEWLGEFVHGFFENYASDEKLTPQHWFWDEAQSGGIFIEHGVHFFDMFEGWLGEGRLRHAIQLPRQHAHRQIVDCVQATVQYRDGLVNFYHGFNQPRVLDRQELRLQFERGDLTLYEWVPVKLRLHGLLTNAQIEKWRQWLPEGAVAFHTDPDLIGRKATGRFRPIAYDALVTLEFGDRAEKMVRYEQLVRSMLEDQWQWIRDASHRRVVDDRNAVASLRIAEAATRLASETA